MATNTNQTQNSVRQALLEKAANGNTSYVRRSNILDHGGSDPSWDWYDKIMCDFEETARRYVSRLFDVVELDGITVEEAQQKRDAELDAICKELIALKKEMLKRIDPEGKHIVSSHDGDVIGIMAHGTEATANNVEGKKGFESTRQDTFASRAKFRHALEGYWGRIILNAGMMSPERATFLREERNLLGKVRSAKKTVDDLSSELTGIQNAKEKASGGAEYFDEVIKNLTAKIEGAKAAQKNAERALKAFYGNNPNGVATEPTIQEVMDKKKKEELKEKAKEAAKEMTMKQMKELLDQHNVKYSKKANKELLTKKVVPVLMATMCDEEPEHAEPEAAAAVAEAKTA